MSNKKRLPKQNKFDRPPTADISYENYKGAVLRHTQRAKEDHSYMWNIFLKSTGELVGWIDIDTISRGRYQMANFGYFILNVYRRNGYAREAGLRIRQAAFEDLKFHRLEAITDPDNKASVAVAKACGFRYEGIKKNYWFENGKWIDQKVLAATPEMF